MRLLIAALLGASFGIGCAATPAPPGGSPEPAGIVRFRDRTIDLAPFFEGFPYKNLTPIREAGRLFFFREGRTRTLEAVPFSTFGDPLDLTKAVPLLRGGIDWNARTFDGMKYLPARGSLVIAADERNDEVFNLYELQIATGELRKITDVPYIYGFGVDNKRNRIAYLPRFGRKEPYRTCLRLEDLAAGTEVEIACDDPALTFTWSDVVFRPDGTGALVAMKRHGDRKKRELVYVSFADRRISVVTPPVERTRAQAVAEWLDDDRFVYASDESGYPQLYRHDLGKRETVQLTTFTDELSTETESSLALFGKPRPEIVVVMLRPYQSWMLVVDAETGATRPLGEAIPGTADIVDHDEQSLTLSVTSLDGIASIVDVPVSRMTLSSAKLRLAPPPKVRAATQRCQIERVEVPTFDIDPKTGKTRLLHAFVLTPKDLPGRSEDRFAIVHSFYGGENVWDPMPQIVCAAGGIWFSPAPRGSWGFGREFYALNDHDLGGDEIVDIVRAGRYLTQRFGLTERQVGLWGRSHGGYATMRLMTLPDGVRGNAGVAHQEPFDWGFGMSDAGFSNIVTFHETCNIPDWVMLEAGDPARERERLIDRSPIAHVGLLRAPLLLTHGENDSRVPVRESRQFAEAARRLGKPVTYVEFAGQGHRVKGLPNEQRLWQLRFDFLAKALAL